MKNITTIATIILLISLFSSYSQRVLDLSMENLDLVNREAIVSEKNGFSTLLIKNKDEDGMAILNKESLDSGTIQLELKGENKPGQSFVGIAFNIQNDSTYEAIYFRPFNFKAKEKERREHSVQYISHPKNTWRYLRTNSEGKYEAEFPNAPDPDGWFKISLKIDKDQVRVYDAKSNTALLRITRLEKPVSDKIGLWTGNNSEGEFRNLRLLE